MDKLLKDDRMKKASETCRVYDRLFDDQIEDLNLKSQTGN